MLRKYYFVRCVCQEAPTFIAYKFCSWHLAHALGYTLIVNVCDYFCD